MTLITARVHQKATIVSTNRLICLRCVLGNDEARTGNMESFEVGPFFVSLISRHGFFGLFGGSLVQMVDYRYCTLLSPLSYDMRRSIDEKFREVTVRIDDFFTTWGFLVEVGPEFLLFFHQIPILPQNDEKSQWVQLEGIKRLLIVSTIIFYASEMSWVILWHSMGPNGPGNLPAKSGGGWKFGYVGIVWPYYCAVPQIVYHRCLVDI